jgi:hypothetical protein
MRKAILCVAVLVVAIVAGCAGGPCHCPASGCDNCSASSAATTNIYLLPDAGSLSSVAADSPCTATWTATNQVRVSRHGPGTCTARIVYSTGLTNVFDVQFTPTTGGCGCYLAGQTSPEQMDAAGDSTGD